jgi:hypothetical protein
MSGILDSLGSLNSGQLPPNVTASSGSLSSQPDWFQQMEQGLAARGAQIADRGYQYYSDPRLANFTPDQLNAFQGVRNMQGSWQPSYQGALGAYGQALPYGMSSLNRGAGYGAGAVGAAQAGAQGAMGAAQQYAPWMTSAAGTYGGAAMDAANSGGAAAQSAANQAGQQMGKAANQYGQGAVSATQGPSQSWTDNFSKYMSPYTQSVVNEIGRLGNQNLFQNVLPQVNDSFIANGGFGSDRNAEMIGRSIRDAQTNISGLQSQALESGYGTSAGIFGQDANRAQQQQQMQSNANLGAGNLVTGALGQAGQLRTNAALGAGQLATNAALGAGNMYEGALGQGANLLTGTALQGGQLASNAGLQAGQMANQGAQIGGNLALQTGQGMGALSQLGQQLGYNDLNALSGIGAQQQGLQQHAYDTAYQEFQNQRDYPMQQASWLSNLLRNAQVPTTQIGSTNAPLPGAQYGATPANQIGGALSMLAPYFSGSGGSGGSSGGALPYWGGGSNDWENYIPGG